MSSELHYMSMAGSAASESLAKAADILAAKRQKSTYTYFANAHRTASGTEFYSRDEYTRVAFKSDADAKRFISDMASQGISAVATPFRVQGQYLAELPNTMADGRSSADVLKDFGARSYVKYDTNPRVDQSQRDRDYNTDVIADEFLMSSEFGQLLHSFAEVNNVLGAGKYGENSNKTIFNTPLSHDGSANSVLGSGTANPIVDSGRAKTATVINDRIVMMDGKVVTDEKFRNYVLSQHEERINKANDIGYKADDKNRAFFEERNLNRAVDYVNKQASVFETLYNKKANGETLSPNQLKDLNKAYDVVSGISKDFGREINKSNPLTAKELRDFNDNLLLSHKLREGNSYTFDIQAWRKSSSEALGVSSSTKALLSRINDTHHHKLGMRETNAAYILNHSDRQEYAISKSFKGIDTLKPTTSVIARWDMGALNKITDQLNTSLTAAYELANTTLVYDLNVKDYKELMSSLDTSKGAKPAVAQIFENMDKGWADALARKKLNSAGDVSKGLYISATERNRIIEIMHKKNLSYADLTTEKGAKEVASLLDEKSRDRVVKTLTTVTEEDKAFIKKMEKEFGEPKRLIQNNKLLVDLSKASWAKGIGLSGSISAMDLATMNKNFLNEAASKGFNFVSATGRFNVKKLQKLSAAEMSKLGLTESTRNMLVQLNAKGAFGSVGMRSVLSKTKKLGKKSISLIRKMDDHGEGWQDISQLTSTIQNMAQGGEAVISGLHSAKTMASAKIDNWRLKHPKKPRSTSGNIGKVKPRTAPNTKELTEAAKAKAAQRAEKLGIKTEKKIAKTIKKQNSLGARFHRATQNFAHRIAQTKIARAVNFVTSALNKAKEFVVKKLAIPIGLLLMKATFFVYIVIVVAVLVIALIDTIKGLFDINAMLAPKTYEDTVAYTLYSQLKDEETKFLAEMSGADKKAYEYLDNISFGYTGQTTKQYVDGTDHIDENGIDNISNVYYDEATKKMYINPFWRGGTVDPTDEEMRNKYCTEVTKFDGTHEYTVTTNLNYYSITSDISQPQKPQYGISNGHTSNIKDIISMTDIMFQMQASDCDTAGGEKGDGEKSGLGNILSASPEQLNWNAFTDSVGRVFSVIGEFFCNLWDWLTGAGTNWEYPTLTTPTSSVTYDTVWKYARGLFILSHQQYIYLDVEYGDINRKLINGDGTELVHTVNGKDVTNLEPSTALYFGINNGVVTTKEFEIARKEPENPASIQPLINGIFLDDGFFDVTISIENYVGGEHELCLWSDMPTKDDQVDLGVPIGVKEYATTNNDIWNRISSMTGGDDKCWHNSDPESQDHDWVKIDAEKHLSGVYVVVTGSGCASNVHTTSGTPMPDASEAVEAVRGELSGKYSDLEPAKKIDTYIIMENSAVFMDFTVNPFNPNITNDSSETVSPPSITEIRGGPDNAVIGSISITTHTWHINVKGEQDVYKYTEYFKYRKCNCKHKFAYDGGHISTHTIANVFSITNEQLAMTGIFDDGNEPLALFDGRVPYADNLTSNHDNYAFEQHYDKFKGKVIKSEVNYTSASTAQTTGGGPTPAEDIYQGTAVSKGLNVTAGGDGASPEGWAKESRIVGSELDPSALTPATSGNYVRLCRDLFDVDCVFLKGALMFPFKKLSAYEGWTADNMMLACNRMCMDWYEVYGFDISQEIGDCNYALSELDIEMLNVGLKAQYGTKYTPERERALTSLLKKVGRGHFSNLVTGQDDAGNDTYAHEHGFLALTETAKTTMEIQSKLSNGDTLPATNVAFMGSCSAGAGMDLLYYARNYGLKMTDNYDITDVSKLAIGVAGLGGAHSYTQLRPADMIYHQPYKYTPSETADEEHKKNYYLDSSTILRDNILINGKALLESHLSEQAVIYVGTFDSAAITAMKEYLKGELEEETYNVVVGNTPYEPLNGFRTTDGAGGTTTVPAGSIMLSQGSYISAGMPIVLDLSQMSMFSGIYFRSEGSTTDDLHEFVGDLDRPFQGSIYNEGSTLQQWYYTSPFGEDCDYILEAELSKRALRTTYYWVIHGDSRTTYNNMGPLWGDNSW